MTDVSPPRRLRVRSSLGRIAWLFLPLGALALTGGLVAAAHHTPDAWAGLGLGTLFTGIAVLFLLTRRSLDLDLGAGTFRYARGLLHPVRLGRLTDLTGVRLHGRTVPDANLEEVVHYAVELEVAGDAPLAAYDVEDPDEGRMRAEILARRLRLPLADERDPARPETLTADEVDARVAARLETAAADDPATPAAVRDGEGHLVLPAAGLGARLVGMGVGLGILGAFLVVAHVIASTHGARVGLGFAAYALPFDLAVLWLGSRLLGGAFGREEIDVTSEGVRVRRRLGALSVGHRRVELERLTGIHLDDTGAVRLETDEAVIELGRGLDARGRRWLLARLGALLGGAATATPAGGA